MKDEPKNDQQKSLELLALMHHQQLPLQAQTRLDQNIFQDQQLLK